MIKKKDLLKKAAEPFYDCLKETHDLSKKFYDGIRGIFFYFRDPPDLRAIEGICRADIEAIFICNEGTAAEVEFIMEPIQSKLCIVFAILRDIQVKAGLVFEQLIGNAEIHPQSVQIKGGSQRFERIQNT